MSDPTDYKRYAILYVDDEEKSLKSFSRAFSEHFRIFTAATAQAGFKLLEEHADDIGVLMTDQRMPGEQGGWLLEKARLLRPQIVRVLATAYADFDAVITAVNTGAIYKYVTKPWDPPQLEMTLKRGLDYFMIQQERDRLLREKMAVLQHIMVADRVISLGFLAAGLSHHIRNSMVAVKTFLDLTPAKLAEENVHAETSRNPDFWKDYYGNVMLQVEKINDLLKDLWLASEKPPFHFTDKVNLGELVARVFVGFDPALRAKNIRVLNEIPADLPALLGDRAKLNRVFELLLKDELASLPDGSTLHFSARPAPDAAPARPEMLVELRDDGPGLPAESLRLLFDPFVVRSDSPQEYGISLMACYFIVHHHGGKIEARAAEPHGTVFSLRLPLDPNHIAPLEDSQELFQKVVANDAVWQKLLAS